MRICLRAKGSRSMPETSPAKLKQKLKVKFRRFGVLDVSGRKIYGKSGRDRYLPG